MSVTSSGRSSINKTINSTSGLFVLILFAIFFNKVVFPTFGGATICPITLELDEHDAPLYTATIKASVLWKLAQTNVVIGIIENGEIKNAINSENKRQISRLGKKNHKTLLKTKITIIALPNRSYKTSSEEKKTKSTRGSDTM